MLFNFICRRFLPSAKPYIKFQVRCNGVASSSLSQITPPSSEYSNQHLYTISYLINSCGLSPESATLASKHLDLSKSLSMADTVLAFLINQGFTKSQVSLLVYRHPNILLCDPEKILIPNFQTLNSIGLSKTDILEIVTARPKGILVKRLQDCAIPCVTFLRSVLGSEDKVIHAIKRFPLALAYDLQVYAAENIQILLEIGVPKLNIVNMLANQPRTLMTSADRFRKVIGIVEEMGFDPTKTRFLWGIHAIRAMSKSTWNKKLALYKKWGWSEDDIFTAFEKHPGCMMASMDKITRILDFLVNTMGWEPSYIAQWPIVICFSLEKRVIPRCLLYQYLAEKGLMEEEDGFCFNKWLMYSDQKFLEWVETRYKEEAPELLKLYQKHLDDANRSNHSIMQKREVVEA